MSPLQATHRIACGGVKCNDYCDDYCDVIAETLRSYSCKEMSSDTSMKGGCSVSVC